MADDLNKKITIDVEITSDGQQQINQYKTGFDSLRSSINGLSANVDSLNKDLSGITATLGKLDNQNKATEASGNKLKETVKDSSDLFGIWKKAIEAVGLASEGLSAAMSGGLTILTLYGPEILKFISSFVKGKEAIDKSKLSLDSLNKAIEGSDYSNVIKQINELKTNVALAKNGFLDKKKVLEQYNATLGLSMGKVAGLNEVESKITKNGSAYIKMTLLKASAQLALQEAAKKAYEAEKEKLKSDDESLTLWDKVVDVMNRNSGAAGPGAPGIQNAGEQADLAKKQKAAQRRTDAIADAGKQKDALLSIAAKFQADAAAIAKQSGFDFFTGQLNSNNQKTGGLKPGNDELIALSKQQTAALTETEKLVKDSLSRQLQLTYEAYGNETMVENNRYQDELRQLKTQFDNKLISRNQYSAAVKQLENEHQSSMAAIIEKYRQQDKDKTEQAQNELIDLQITGMKAGTEKQIAELQQQQIEKSAQLDKTEEENTDRIKQLYKEINDAKAADRNTDTSELQRQIDAQLNIIEINCKKRELLEKQTTEEIKKIRADEAQQQIEQKDNQAIDDAGNPAAKLAAEKQLITDKYDFEYTQAEGNAAKQKQLKQKYENDITLLTKKAEQDRKEFAAKTAQDIANAAFSIIQNSIRAQSETKIKSLETDKAKELSNSSLTSAQKFAIEEKYKQKENQVKIKAFKDEQKASIGQAVINGAIAVTKAESQTGVLGEFVIPLIIAQTAIQVATIASQKPPQYAKGGLYYASDGKGALLPGYSRTDNTNAYLRSGEAVVVSEAMRDPWARNLVSAINVAYGGRDFAATNPTRGYAIGGIFTDGGNSNRYYNQPVHDQKDLANTLAYQMINNFPPIYVDVKDVNNQQNILAQTTNRVNL